MNILILQNMYITTLKEHKCPFQTAQINCANSGSLCACNPTMQTILDMHANDYDYQSQRKY